LKVTKGRIIKGRKLQSVEKGRKLQKNEKGRKLQKAEKGIKIRYSMGKICGKISSLRAKRWRKIPLGFFLLVNSEEKKIIM
jgi:hypothetical protein